MPEEVHMPAHSLPELKTGNAPEAALLFGALAAVTLAAMLFVPLIGAHMNAGGSPFLWSALMVLSYGHVGTTAWFGADPDYGPVVAAHRWRMLGSLVALPIAMATIGLAIPGAVGWIFAAYIVWQAHHFNKQNYGLIALAAVHDRAGKLPQEIGTVLMFTTFAGATGMVLAQGIFPNASPPAFLLDPTVRWVGRGFAIGCLGVAAVAASLAIRRHAALRRSPWTLLFLGLMFAFYLPSLGTGPGTSTFWPFIIAHGLQYLTMMLVTARNAPRRAGGAVAVVALALGFGWVGSRAGTPILTNAFTGIFMWHFLADARLWRLRDPQIRILVARRFAFVFPRVVQPTIVAPQAEALALSRA
jgi:hypothetical protein